MEGYEAPTYGDRIASIYDELWGELLDPAPTVDALAELAGGGRALELAIGTGRVALPLKERGVEVHGIDISEAMVERLRGKVGGEDIPVAMGDFADVDVDGKFELIFIVFNTFFALTTQEDQVRCFHNVAAHLTDDGVFAMEGFVPDLARFDRHQRVGVTRVTADALHLEASRHDPVRQTVDSQQALLEDGKPVRMYPVHIRYAFPSELDLMAQLAGLRLRDRWGGWNKEPFTSASPAHVSVYARG